MELRGPFEFVEKAVRATTTCLNMADHKPYSVDARAAGRMVLYRSHAERIVVLLGDEGVAAHPRDFRRYQIISDPWHYLPVLAPKPGALRNGAPFKGSALPPALAQVRAELKQHVDGIGTSSKSSVKYWLMACRPWRLPAPRRSRRGSPAAT